MRRAEPLAGLGGIALFVSLFLTWFESGVAVRTVGAGGSERTDVLGSASLSGWQALTVVDILLALLALLALAVPLTSVATKGPAKSIGTAVLASAFGWIAILLVLFRIVFPPFDEAARSTGAWVALA